MRDHVLVASIGAAVLTLLGACSRPPAPVEPVRAVRTMVVRPLAAAGVREYAAEVRARTESRLSFRVGGKVLRRNVDVGDAVKAGQALAQLDPQDLRLGQDAARAAVAAAQVNHEQAVVDYKRYKDLRDQGFISTAELERRDTVWKSAKAQLDQAQAAFGVQGNQAGYAALVADAPGVVTGVDVEPGMVVAAGTPVLRLAHDGPRDAVFAVPEDQVDLVKALASRPGRIGLRLCGRESAPLAAQVREIAAAADPATRTFQVKADIGAAAVRLGQTATVLVQLPPTEGVAKLPLSALREDQGRTTVWLVDPASMTIRLQPVDVTGADGNDAFVTAGLAPGQVVVTAGVHVLTAGQKVRYYVDPDNAVGAAAALPVSTQVTVK